MRRWFRKWLGIDEIERRQLEVLVAVGRLSPEQADEVVSGVVKTDYKLINENGGEGQL